MQLAISNIAWSPEKADNNYRLLQKLGIHKLEIAPSLLMNSTDPYDHLNDATHISHKLRDQYGLNIISMQSIWYGVKDNIFSNTETRSRLINYTNKAIDFAVAVDCRNLVFGCPKNRIMDSTSRRDDALSFFNCIGNVASEKGCIISIEPNPIIYGTNFLNTTTEVVHFLMELNNPGIKLNLDLGTIIYNKEELENIKGIVSWVNHVHISEPNLEPIQKRLDLHLEITGMFPIDQVFSIEMKQTDQSTIRSTIKYLQAVLSNG